MKLLFRFIFLFLIGINSITEGQSSLTIDPANVKGNFMDVNYFNNIWLKSRDISKDDATGFANRASQKIDKGFYEEAYSDILKAISVQPSYAFPYFLKGVYFLNRNMIDSSKVAFIYSLRLDSVKTLPLFYLGLASTFSEDYSKAEEYFYKLISGGENQYLGFYGMANLALTKNEVTEGRSWLKKTITAKPDFIQATFTIGLIDFILSNPRSTSNWMDKIFLADPKFAPAYLLKGLSLLNLSMKSKEGLEYLSKAIELDPNNVKYLNIRAAVLKYNKEPDLALKDVEKIIEKICIRREWTVKSSPSFDLNNCWEVYYLLNLYRECKSLLVQNNRSHFSNFILEFYFRNYYDARSEAEIIHKSEDSPVTDILLGMCQEKLLSPQTSGDYYKRAKERLPQLYFAYLREGVVNYKLKKYNEAIADLNKVAELNDTILETYRWRGFSYGAVDNQVRAVADFNRYLLKDSADIDIRFDRAAMLTKAESFEAAVKDLNMVLFYDEKDIEAVHLKAECLYNLGEFSELIKLLEQIDYNKLKPEEKKMLGFAYFQTGNHIKSIDIISKYLSYNTDDIQALTWRGTSYFTLNRYSEALTDFDRCISLKQGDGVLYYLHGMTNLKLKKTDSACSDFFKAESYGFKVPFNFKDSCGK